MAETTTVHAAFCYSTNGEDYEGGFATREDAEREGREMAESDEESTFYTARAVPWQPVVDGAVVLDALGDRAYEAVGEHAEGWPRNMTPEQHAELTEALTAAYLAWATKHKALPGFYGVADVQEHHVPAPAEVTP